MDTVYLKDFVFKQKCVPWFVTLKWRCHIAQLKKLLTFVWEYRQVRTIDLENSYESSFLYHDTFESICVSKTYRNPVRPFTHGVHVKFLEEFKDKIKITDEDIKSSEHYKAAWLCIKAHGKYQDIQDDAGLVRYCRDYLNFYHFLKANTDPLDRLNPIRSIYNGYKYGYPWVFKNVDPSFYIVFDGHHRLACEYMLGRRYATVRIVGLKKGGEGRV